MKALAEYKKKRDFKITAEPAGKVKRERGHSFVIQKHDASHLHYDFRLEVDGVLKSWAVPKGPSLDPHVKRLAVEVEDHPLDYASFEGTIPAGQYGAGEVIVWDRGTWKPEGDVSLAKQLRCGRLHFTLNGEKLHGAWNLVRTRQSASKPNWLLFKASDPEARPESEYDVTEARAESVLSGELLGQKKRSQRKRIAVRTRQLSAEPDPVSAEPLGSDPMPEFVAPQLATLVAEPPAEKHFLHEIKFDGYRALARIEHHSGNAKGSDTRAVTLYTRNGNDWTRKFAPISEALAHFNVDSAYLDGEIVVFNDKGQSDFQALQNALKASANGPLTYVVFDLLFLNGHDLRELPLAKRKELLKMLIDYNKHDKIHYSDHFEGNPVKFLQGSCKQGLEGIICKDGQKPYSSGRHPDWLKVKCTNRQEFVIVGYSLPMGSRMHIGALLMAVNESDGRLRYVGRVGTGFSQASLKQLHLKLAKLVVGKSPVYNSPQDSDIKWVRPSLVAEVQFGAWTKDKILRHAVFSGLREDKPTQDIVLETPAEVQKETQKGKTQKARLVAKESKRSDSESVELTNPGKILFPPDGPTKQELAEYYQQIARRAWHYIENRPLALFRCPEGHKKACFYQKHVEKARIEPGFAAAAIKEKSGTEEYRYLVAPSGLRSVVQLGALELHTWGSRITDVEHPDELVFDLDPAPDVAWKEVVAAAKTIRDVLARLQLKSFPKLTGGKGVHIHVPIVSCYSWTQAKSFCQALAKQLEADQPLVFTSTAVKAKRTGKIYIDFLRNQRGSHYIAPFSPRARDGAPIAVPISWAALSAALLPNAYTVRTIGKYLQDYKRDPWGSSYRKAQRVPLLDQTSAT